MANKVPVIFNEHFNKTITKICDELRKQSTRIMHDIPTLTNTKQLSEHTNSLLNIMKKEIEDNFLLLYNMTHIAEESKYDDDDNAGFTVVKNKKSKKKSTGL